MAVELRILSGALAGQHASFDKPLVTIGRHPQSDLRFNPTQDIDVSTQHAEIRSGESRVVLHDKQSTNGTLVNGARLPSGGSRQLYDGDVIAFGAKGPQVEVAGVGPRPAGVDRTRDDEPAVGAMRTTTTQRIAVAVRDQTRGLKMLMAGLVVVLVALGGGAWWVGHRTAQQAEEQNRQILKAYEDQTVRLQAQIKSTDTALKNGIQRKLDSVRSSRVGAADTGRGRALQRQIQELAAIDLTGVVKANDAAVVLIRTEIGASTYEATGFAIGEGGLIVTNRHVVTDDNDTKATKVLVKFANTHPWLVSHVVKIADDPTVDLALIEVDQAGHYPVVRSVSAKGVDEPVGEAIVTLGFPLGTDLAMEGSGDDVIPKTTMTAGHISKTLPDVLQIDSFAGHGSSGSPVFDADGHVIGVVYGGAKDTGGRVVYAVPSDRILDLRKAAGR